MTTVTLTSANNNWTAPAWVYAVQVEVWGAGGGGAGSNNNTTGAAGGGGGAYARSNVAVIPGTVYTVSIPTGGAGGGNNAAGTAGGNTNFNNNQIKAVGGNGAGVHAAGNGGLNNACVGDVTYSGGTGFAPGTATRPGGGGGAGAGNAANGATATAQAGATGANSGGSGGNGGNNNTVGNNGITPAGGGGGGGNRTSGTKTGGTGGAGQIVITYTAAVPIVLSASNNIGANAADNTTALMTAPANKTSGNNFQAGKISDDTNPLPAIDLASDKYTELEWSVKAVGGIAANNEVYLLRVSANGTPLTTYTVTPQWTIGGGTSAITGSDSGTLSEATTLTATATLTDDGTLTDASQLALPGTDSAELSESSALETATPIAGTDSAELSESVGLSIISSATDSAELSESIGLMADLTGSDDATLSEASALVEGNQVDGSDSGTLSEEPSEMTATLAATDSGTLTDTSAPTVEFTPTDDATLSEVGALTVAIALTDTFGLTDTSALTVAIAATDTFGLSDAGVVSSAGSNHTISVGDGYTDVTGRQVVRTSDNRLWIASWKFDDYPQGTVTGLGQTLRMYKANQTGTPSAFTRMDSAHEPVDVNSWAMAVGASDVIHVVWTKRASWVDGHSYFEDGTDNAIYYCQFNTSSGLWGTPETIETAAAIVEMGQGDDLCAIAVDASGVPHIVYLKSDGTRRRVNYRNRTGGTWSSATVVDDQSFSTDQRCWHPGICFDQAGRIVVTWLRGAHTTSDDGRIFIRVYASGSWGTTHDVVGANVFTGIDNGTPLYIDAANRYHICYITTSATKYVQYRYSDNLGVSWTANHPNSGTWVGDDPTPGPGALGKVRIYAHGLAADNYPIVYWQGDGGSASWGTVSTYSSAAVPNDCSVNVRWCRYYWWYPNTLDVAFWTSNYPTNALYVGMDIAATDFYPTDSATLGEASSIERTIEGVDSATFSEATMLDKPVDGTDTLTLSEATGLTYTISASDNAALSDAGSLAAARGVSDSGVLSEASALAAAPAAVDSGTLSESSALAATGLTVNDSGTLSEASSLAAAISVSDSATLSGETAGVLLALVASESATLTELSDLTTGDLLNGTDAFGLSEASSLAVVISATEICTLSEAGSLAVEIGVTDDAVLAELSDLTIGLRVDSTDSWTLSETSSLDVVMSATEVFTLDEALTIEAAWSATDAWTMIDASELSGDQIVRDIVRLGLYIDRGWSSTMYIKQTKEIDLEL